MSSYRFFDGAIQRQDVAGGDWSPLSKDEANAVLASVPDPMQPQPEGGRFELIVSMLDHFTGKRVAVSFTAREWRRPLSNILIFNAGGLLSAMHKAGWEDLPEAFRRYPTVVSADGHTHTESCPHCGGLISRLPA